MEIWQIMVCLFCIFIVSWVVFYIGYRIGYNDAAKKSCEILTQMMNEAKEKQYEKVTEGKK